MRLETAKLLKKVNQRSKTVRQKKRETKTNAKETNPEHHVDISRVPRIKKNKLADPPKATSKYKRRQVSKTWLPTHLWHTKRARMTAPTHPLWRMAIPITPTEKSYRPTHRAGGSRGSIAWDASYMSTVACLGTDHTLGNMLRLLGFGVEGAASRQRKWIAGTRHGQGWIHEIDQGKKPITPAVVVWVARSSNEGQRLQQPTEHSNGPHGGTEPAMTKQKIKLDRKLLIRVHVSAFRQFWLELLRAAKMQKPQVLVEDLRFEVGSIEITGPGSTEALLGVLKPRNTPSPISVEAAWTSLAALNNPGCLPHGSLLAFDVVDPRLSYPPKQVKIPKDQASVDKLNELIASWPIDTLQTTPKLSSHKVRWIASTTLPTQNRINRRRAEAGQGKAITVLEKDPAIPVLLLANRSQASDANTQGSWTVLLPWCCVDAVWRSLMYYPSFTGRTPRFGGLHETRQIGLEHLTPWHPGDFPGTEAGKAWERTESEKRFDEWIRRPPSRRLKWDLVELGLGRRGEIGRGWTCDWEYLFVDTLKARDESAVQKTDTRTEIKAQEDPDRRRNTSSPESEAGPDRQSEMLESSVDFSQLTPSLASSLLKAPLKDPLLQTPSIATVRIRLLTKGTPNPAARVYRLPTSARATAASQMLVSSPTQLSTHPANSNGATSNQSAPPAGQPSPSTGTTSSNQTSTATSFANLREKWMSLLPSNFSQSGGLNLPKHPKQKQNDRGLPSKHVVHPYDPPTHINVLPRNAPQSVIDEFGRKPLTAEQLHEQRREMLMKELMKNEVAPGETWDASKGLVECPNPEDLIGFVTSGSYNLCEGSGTAIGGIWVQRLIQGWRDERISVNDEPIESVSIKSVPHKTHKRQPAAKKSNRLSDPERHLCVVRNAGESVGRLAIWELCQ